MERADFLKTPTLTSAFAQFLDSAPFARRTRESYTDDLAPLLVQYGQSDISVLTAEIIQAYLARQDALAPTTYNRRLASLRSFLNFLHTQGWQISDLLVGVERKARLPRSAKSHLDHFEALMARANWLLALPISTEALASVPDAKIQRFATEALALDANRMKDLQGRKRSTLALSLLRVQRAQILDDVAEMFCKRMLKIQHQGQEAFDLAQKAAHERITRLIEALRDVTSAYEKEGTVAERMDAVNRVYGGASAQILNDCEAQLALLANTSFPFLRTFVSRHRASLFRFLSTVTLRSPHQNKALEETIQFLQANEHRSGKYLRTARRASQRFAQKDHPAGRSLLDVRHMAAYRHREARTKDHPRARRSPAFRSLCLHPASLGCENRGFVCRGE